MSIYISGYAFIQKEEKYTKIPYTKQLRKSTPPSFLHSVQKRRKQCKMRGRRMVTQENTLPTGCSVKGGRCAGYNMTAPCTEQI